MTPVEICRVLLVGPVAAADVPELDDDQTRAEVCGRLAAAGCELVYAPDASRWMARLDGALPRLDGHEPVLWLSSVERAVLAACWLHLRFLPLERARALAAHGADAGLVDAWLDLGDLGEQFAERVDEGELGIALGNLIRAGFLVRREGRLEAGPLLDTIDEARAAERARALLARHQRLAYLERRTARLDGGASAQD